MQLRLLRDQTFAPIRTGGFRYVPALLDWSGERDALSRAAESVWDRCTPLVQLTPPGMTKKDVIARSTVVAWARRLAEAVNHHPLFLDTIGIRDVHRVAGQRQSVLHHLHQAARHEGLNFVPVVSVGSGAGENAAAHSNATDGRGVALRLRVAEIGPDRSMRELLDSSLTSLDVAPQEADAIIDFGYLRPDDEWSTEDVVAVVSEVASVGHWRNIVFLATSIPASMTEIAEGTLGAINQREWELWSELAKSWPTISFGDYGIQHPRPPNPRGGPGMRASVRYPTEAGVLVARGEGPILQLPPPERAAQYRRLCHDLVMNRLFVGADCCPGDRLIQGCADGQLVARGQAMWRAAGTAHNLAMTTSRLARAEQRERRDAVSGRSAAGLANATTPASARR